MPISTDNYECEISEGKNLRSVKCSYCNSSILAPSTANFVKQEFHLPLMKQVKTDQSDSEPQKELIATYWYVPDMYVFLNVGFSHTVGNTKYLTCADCEAGPVGYHDLGSGKSYVALTRVKHC